MDQKKKKSWTYPFFALHLNTHPFYSLARMTKPLHSKISIDASEHPRLGWASRSSAELHGRQSMFEDPAQDRAWFVADPALQDPGLNLTFTLFVNGFCFLFFVFVFRHQSGKPIFPVLCLLLRWVSFFISGVRVGWVLRHEGEHKEERRDEIEERRQN